MVPDNQMWNYNFVGLGLVQNMKYALVLSNPKDFYHEIHRASHFIKFVRNDEEQEETDIVDKEDFFYWVGFLNLGEICFILKV